MHKDCHSLEELWASVHELNKGHFPENDLEPILGNGKTFRPRIMFVFINPTKANTSSDKKWSGPRFPFIGTKAIWRVFHKAGMFDDGLIEKINFSDSWSVDFSNEVLGFLRDKSFYFTNIVKWTGHDSALPDSDKIRLFLPILENEIKLIQPRYIVAFGLIPFNNMTGKKIRLADYYAETLRTGNLKFYELKDGGINTKVIPCYFPVGRGNPKKAIDILKLINSAAN